MKTNSAFYKALFKHRFTLLSLVIILGMYGIINLTYAPDNFLRVSAINIADGALKNVGGEFKMTTQKGQSFTHKKLEDKVSLIFFCYTYSPEICPTTLSKLSHVYEVVSDGDKKNLNIIFVTLDPQRDTQKALKEYTAVFNPHFISLRGTEEQTKSMAQAYSVYYAKSKADESGNYTIDHTNYIYLMDKNGDYIKHFTHETAAEEILSDLFSELRKERNKRRRR